jgi:hypothetical protein
MLEIAEPDRAALAMRRTLVVAGLEAFEPDQPSGPRLRQMKQAPPTPSAPEPDHRDIELHFSPAAPADLTRQIARDPYSIAR